MEEKDCKQIEEILSEIYRNAQLALQSISNILPQVEDEEIKKELGVEHEEYERFSASALMLAKDNGIELKEPNPFKKMMMWGSIKMNSMMDNSRAHIADMMLQGTVMGITALRKSKSETCVEENGGVLSLLDEMLAAEERFEKTWKGYL